MIEIVLASGNAHKVRELRAMFKSLDGFELLNLHHFPKYTAPEETGNSLEENARIKATHAAKHLRKWVLADDTGIFVPMLNGAPGVHSGRYAGPNATDVDKRKKLLKEMAHLTDISRSAYCECCLVLCHPDGTEKLASGKCEGYILTEERGGNGFGYDPIFAKHDYDKSFAELEESVKNRISHRYKAFEKLVPTLESLMW